jgi:REP element-mobilizing transposase RayT
MASPLAYFITFHCYGTWLQGQEPGSVDRAHNQPGTPFLPPDPETRRAHRDRMSQPPYYLNTERQTMVLQAIQEVCRYRKWRLIAAHIRVSHVHVVVSAESPPEKVMNDFKAYASRALNQAGIDPPGRERWSRHGSTRYLNDDEAVVGAADYVVRRQGEPMVVYEEAGTCPGADTESVSSSFAP